MAMHATIGSGDLQTYCARTRTRRCEDGARAVCGGAPTLDAASVSRRRRPIALSTKFGRSNCTSHSAARRVTASPLRLNGVLSLQHRSTDQSSARSRVASTCPASRLAAPDPNKPPTRSVGAQKACTTQKPGGGGGRVLLAPQIDGPAAAQAIARGTAVRSHTVTPLFVRVTMEKRPSSAVRADSPRTRFS
mgnify:CR=1 FL=1